MTKGHCIKEELVNHGGMEKNHGTEDCSSPSQLCALEKGPVLFILSNFVFVVLCIWWWLLKTQNFRSHWKVTVGRDLTYL